jgi:hypothetical protein
MLSKFIVCLHFAFSLWATIATEIAAFSTDRIMSTTLFQTADVFSTSVVDASFHQFRALPLYRVA